MSEEGLERLRGLALRYLGRRERTVAEVRERLARAEASEAQAEQVITELQADGLIDDARYARLFVEDRRTLDGWGSERIERSLRERGIDRDLIAAAFAETDDERTELDRALELLRRRFPQPPVERRERDRALGVMIRKGFETEVALDALAAHARAA
jgi:regulatory protein